MVLFLSFWNMTAQISNHIHYIERSGQYILQHFSILQKNKVMQVCHNIYVKIWMNYSFKIKAGYFPTRFSLSSWSDNVYTWPMWQHFCTLMEILTVLLYYLYGFINKFSFVHTVQPPVGGQTSDFVNQILENTGKGDPTGGLVGLRVPTSKV